MEGWTTVPQPDDPRARVKEGEGGEVRLLWGGSRGNVRGDDHGDLVSNDGLNAEYLRLPGGEIVVDVRRDHARSIVEEAKGLERMSPTVRIKRLGELEKEWNEKVELHARPGRELASELADLRKQLSDARNDADKDLHRQRRRDRNR